MATSVTLKDLQAASQERWGDYVIEDLGVTLRHALRLSEEERTTLAALQSKEEEEGEGAEEGDVVQRITDTIRLLASDPKSADALLKAIGGDITVLVTIMEQYAEATQLGEASDSEN